MVRLTEHDEVSRETVRRRLKENDLKPWRRDMWCIPKVDAEYVARMEDVLDLYGENPEPARPVVCFDASPNQLIGLIGEVRAPIPAQPGQPQRYDYEYRPTVHSIYSSCSTPIALAPRQGHRAANRKRLRPLHARACRCTFPPGRLHSSHSLAALYRTFPAPEARRLIRRLGVCRS